MDALLSLYTNTDIIGQAVAAERRLRSTNHEAYRAEHTAVTQEMEKAQAAIDRYLNAFETGSPRRGPLR